jgi:hypothetical protein
MSNGTTIPHFGMRTLLELVAIFAFVRYAMYGREKPAGIQTFLIGVPTVFGKAKYLTLRIDRR